LPHAWQPSADRGSILDAALDVVFYVPLGLVLFEALARRYRADRSAAVTPLSVTALSASLELAQPAVPSRHICATDLLFNVAGTANRSGTGSGASGAVAAAGGRPLSPSGRFG
jgi:VanZ family protein